jgi:hypothetical protein
MHMKRRKRVKINDEHGFVRRTLNMKSELDLKIV